MLSAKLCSGLAAVCALAVLAAPRPAMADGAFRTVLVIDASSSMRRTDPGELRKVAAELFVDLARDGDRIAVTGFDGAARQSTGGLTVVRGMESRQQLKQAIRAVGNDGDWTDFTAGLGEARRLLESAPRGRGDQDLVIFLTDGRCEPDPAGPLAAQAGTEDQREAACRAAVLDELAGALGGARVYAIGLSRGAPAGFLEELGRRTGGQGVVTLDPRELPQLFAGVYARLLGSRLQQGSARRQASFTVYEGAESLDLVIVGRTRSSERVLDPGGAEVPIDNRDPGRAYFAATDEYRFYKIARPQPGEWAIELPGRGQRRFATLQHFDLMLDLIEPPAVVETGQPVALVAAVRMGAGQAAPAELLDRHRLHVVIEVRRAAERPEDGPGHEDPERAQASGEVVETVRVPLVRRPDGRLEATYTPAAAGERGGDPGAGLGLGVGLALEPGPGGMLQRATGTLARIAVIPPVHLTAAPIDLGACKQGREVEATLSLAGSELGTDLEVDLGLDGDWLALAPAQARLAADPSQDRALPLRFTISDQAPAGPARLALTVRPRAPAGFPGDLEDRAVTVPVTVAVEALTFWERHGRAIVYGSAGLALVLLLIGWLAPARFPKRAILYYKDVRDPDLARQSSYPLGVKVRPGLFRGARVRVGATGPVKRGGVVELRAASGRAVEATPLAAGATVRKAPVREDEDDLGGLEEDRPRVPLRDGRFRLAPGTGYEIEGSGLVFWYK